MGFLDWIGQGLSQIVKAINEKIASFEKATGIDIPFVGARKEEISKPSTPTPAPPQQAPTPAPTPPQQTTYRVELGTTAHQRQIEEIKQQVGGGKVVVTPEGKIAVEFQSANPPKEVRVTPYEEIIKQQEQERLKQQVSEIYEKASPLEKLGLHAHTFFSGKGLEYIWSYLPGGKSPEDVVKEKMIEAVKTPQTQYAVQTTVGSLFGSPTGVVGASMLAGAGAGAVVGKVAPIAEKIPAIAKVGQFIAEHPTATKVVTGMIVGGIEVGKGAVMYKTLEEQKVPKEEIAEKIGAEISRDVLAMAGFGYGFKYGLEKTLPQKAEYIIGSRTEEKTIKLVAGMDERIPEVKYAEMKIPRTEKFVEPQPGKEWLEAVKKGKIVKETPNYVIKEYGGREFIISETPPEGWIPQKVGEESLIDVLRAERTGYVKLGVAEEGKYAGMEFYFRKGAGIPVTFQKPSGAEFEPTFLKPSGKPRPVLKELAESYKARKLAEEAELAKRIAETENQQLRAIEEGSKKILGIEPVEKVTKEVTSGGLKLLAEPKETGFVPLEPVAYPVALKVVSEPSVSFVTPTLVTPTLIPRETTKPKEIVRQELRVIEKPEKTFESAKLAPIKIEVEKPREVPKPTPIIPPPIEKQEPRITQTLIPKEKTTPRQEKIITPIEIAPPKPAPTVTTISYFAPLPILFPELPKGSVSKATLEYSRMFKQMTKYEPSLLGILLGKKRKGREEFFTGFEIRGI
jgi:hypothetical protein